MSKVAAKQAAREKPKFPDDLRSQPCPYCGTPIVWCKGNGRVHGTRPVSVEMAPGGVVGDVAIERELLGGLPNGAPFAYETNVSSRFRMHGPHCAGSFVGQARKPKARS